MIVDDRDAELEGPWTEGTGLRGFVAHGYHYAARDAEATARFQATVERPGRYEVRLAWLPHENRGKTVPVTVTAAPATNGQAAVTRSVNMSRPPRGENGFESLGTVDLRTAGTVTVELSARGADGHVHADAIQVVRVGDPRGDE